MSARSELDIRWPIGLLFSIMGVLVALYGVISPERTEYRMPGAATQTINLNLCWGVVMLVFGVLMVLGAMRADRKSRQAGD